MKRLATAGLLVTGLLIGCGDSGPSAQEKREAVARLERAEERKAKAFAAARAKECADQLGDFLATLEELGARLEVGVNYTEYFTELGDIQVAYNRLPLDNLHPRCLGRVGVPSEKAFQSYVHAGEVWEECINTLSCEDDGIDPEVQAEWSKASAKLEQATGLGMVEVGAIGAGDEEAAAKAVKRGTQ